MRTSRKPSSLIDNPFNRVTNVTKGGSPSNKISSVPVNLKGRSILFVEDDVFNQQLTGLILSRCGCYLAIAAHGGEALDLIMKRRFDLVLMDIGMPVMDGVQTTRIIREELGITTPVIAITGDVHHEDLRRYRQAGINAHLAKPYNQQQLLSMIANVVGPFK
jgi:CheY-like chemotaxis protein